MNTYTLNVKETGNKNAKYHYTVTNDQTGEVVTERKSNREYVACTINGQYFFGRLDLIGKGGHGQQVKEINEKGRFLRYERQGNDLVAIFDTNDKTQVPIAYKK